MATFGFSFGDFVAGIRLLQSVIDALNTTSGAKAEYRGLISQLYSLERALIAIKELELNEDSAEYNATQQAVRGCQECIDKFILKIARYQSLTAGKSSIRDHIRKITWAQCKQSDLQKFKDDMGLYLSAINVLLNTLQLSFSRQNDVDDSSRAKAQRDALDQAVETIKDGDTDQAARLERIEALLRSQNTIHTRSKSCSFIVRPLRLIDAPIAANYVPRSQVLMTMEEKVLPPSIDTQQLLVLSGPGGIGKSQLARAYATKHQHDYDSVFWTDGRSEQCLQSSVAQIAELIPLPQVLDSNLKLPLSEGSHAKALNAVHAWLTAAGNSRWLIIIDNVDAWSEEGGDMAEVGGKGSYDLYHYLPSVSQGTLVITSRLSYLAREIGAQDLPVGEMNNKEALQLLHAASDRPFGEPGAEELVQKLGAYPLALVQAANYIYESHISTQTYLERYEADMRLLIHQQPKRREYRNGSIDVTLRLSFESLKNSNPEAAAFLLFSAFLDGKDVFWNLLGICPPVLGSYDYRVSAITLRQFERVRGSWLSDIMVDERKFDEAVSSLRKLSFVRWSEESDGFSIHAVIQNWIVSYCDSQTRSQLLAFAADIVGLNFGARSDTPSQRIRPHADRCIDLAKDNHDFRTWAFPTLFLLGAFYYDGGEQDLAQQLLNTAITKIESTFGHKSAMTALWRMRSSPMFIHTEPKDAIIQQLFDAEKELCSSLVQPYRRFQNQIDVKNHLCYAYQMQGDFKTALEIGQGLMHEIAERSEQKFDLIFTCCTQGLLAESYLALGQYEAAKQGAIFAITQHEYRFGKDPKDGSLSAWRRRNMTIMAIACAHLGDLELAEIILVSVHVEAVRFNGPDDELSVHARQNLEYLRQAKAKSAIIGQALDSSDHSGHENVDENVRNSRILQQLSTDRDIVYTRFDLAYPMFDTLTYVDEQIRLREKP